MAAPAFPKRTLGWLAIFLSISIPAICAGFDPNVNGTVYALAVAPDGRIVIGGAFTTLKPNGAQTATRRVDLARVNADGSLDTTFDPEPNGTVTAIAVQSNGQILIGGNFTTVQPNGGAVVARHHIARFNANGTLDTAFDPNATGPAVSPVSAIALQSNGQILIGGNFTFLQPNGASAAIGINRLARLNADGSLDTSFNPNINGAVNAIAVQSNGKIVFGGSFSGVGTTTRNHVARVDTKGVLDTAFDPNTNGVVDAVAVDTSGKIIVGGNFTSVQPNGATGTSTQNYVARFNPDDGSSTANQLDASFNPQPGASVHALLVQTDGNVIMAGAFTTVQPNGGATFPDSIATGAPKLNYVARVYGGTTNTSPGTLTTTGTTDAAGNPIPDFLPNPNYVVYALALQSNGQVLIGGSFTQLKADSPYTTASSGIGVYGAPAVARNGVARVNADGSVDVNSDLNSVGGVGPVVVQSDGRVLVGGSFTTIGGAARTGLARLSSTGVVEAAFNPVLDGIVSAIALQSNGQILIGGTFQHVGSTAQPYIARLNADGSLDTTFTPSPNDPVRVIAIESDGRILFGGIFTQVNGTGEGHLARVSSSGALESTFNPNPDSEVDAILLQPSDNAIIIGGRFTTVTPLSTFTSTGATYIARLNNNDGSVDTGFLPQPGGPVDTIVLQSDGNILMGGEFTTIQPGGATTSTFTSSGTLTASINPVYTRPYVARITTGGALDQSFMAVPDSVVRTLTLQSNGQILVGGYFTTLNGGHADISLGRLNSNSLSDSAFAVATNGVVNSFAVQSDGKILVGGNFSQVLPTGATSLVTRYHLVRLNSNGTLDTGFNVTQ